MPLPLMPGSLCWNPRRSPSLGSVPRQKKSPKIFPEHSTVLRPCVSVEPQPPLPSGPVNSFPGSAASVQPVLYAFKLQKLIFFRNKPLMCDMSCKHIQDRRVFWHSEFIWDPKAFWGSVAALCLWCSIQDGRRGFSVWVPSPLLLSFSKLDCCCCLFVQINMTKISLWQGCSFVVGTAKHGQGPRFNPQYCK